MIILTEAAQEQVKKLIGKRGKGVGICIGVKTMGCSGLAYTVEFVDEPCVPCLISKNGDVMVFVDPKDEFIISGITMDYVKRGLNEGFEFINSKEKARCGCGSSFQV